MYFFSPFFLSQEMTSIKKSSTKAHRFIFLDFGTNCDLLHLYMYIIAYLKYVPTISSVL